MNTRKLQAAALIAAALVAGSAFADGAEYEYPQPIAKTAVRPAERIAAVDEYQANRFAKADPMAAARLLRAQVVAEAIETRRLGLIPEGDGAMPVPTAAQLEQVRLAGQAAVAKHLAAAKGTQAQ